MMEDLDRQIKDLEEEREKVNRNMELLDGMLDQLEEIASKLQKVYGDGMLEYTDLNNFSKFLTNVYYQRDKLENLSERLLKKIYYKRRRRFKEPIKKS